jgi:hypothetical protein
VVEAVNGVEVTIVETWCRSVRAAYLAARRGELGQFARNLRAALAAQVLVPDLAALELDMDMLWQAGRRDEFEMEAVLESAAAEARLPSQEKSPVITCPRCRGTGREGAQTCPRCMGFGWVPVRPRVP